MNSFLQHARVIAGVVVSATLVACASSRGATSPASPAGAQLELSPDAERVAQRTLLDADLARNDSVGRGEPAALASLFTAEVLYLYPGIPVVEGRDSARAVLREAGQGLRVIRWQPLRAEIARSGDFGYTIGYALREPADTTARVRFDRYQAVWVRRDGRWQIDAYAEMPAAPLPKVTRPAAELPVHPAADATGSQAMDADRLFAADGLRIGAGEAFAKWAAADAVLGGERGELTIGAPAIGRSFGPQPRGSSLEWRPVFGRGASSGDLAFTVGQAVSTQPAANGKLVSRRTKYLTIWRRTPDGMRWVSDGGNAR